MLRTMLKSKIHRATVTDADVSYEGSVTIDRDLMEAADLTEYEEVHIWDLSSGQRLVTYVIEGERGSGTIAINGAAAHLVRKGDEVIIGCFAAFDPEELRRLQVKKVFVDASNRIVRTEHGRQPAVATAAAAVGVAETLS